MRIKFLFVFIVTVHFTSAFDGPCGGLLESDAGEYKFPLEEIMEIGKVCVWIVKVVSRQNVQFNLTALGEGLTVSLYEEHGPIRSIIPSRRLNSSDEGISVDNNGQTLIVVLTQNGSGQRFTFSWDSFASSGPTMLTAANYINQASGQILWSRYNTREMLTLSINTMQPESLIVEANAYSEDCSLANHCQCTYIALYEITSNGFLREASVECGRSSNVKIHSVLPNVLVFVYLNSTHSMNARTIAEIKWVVSKSDTPSTTALTTPKSTTTTVPSTTKQPIIITEPSAITMQSTTTNPLTTKPPDTTELSATTQTLTTTDPPATTETPSTTDPPATTETPSTTDPPATIGSPTTTDPPATTGTPSTTDPPATTGSPSNTDPPATTETPSTTDPPATTETPSTTDPPATIGSPTTTDPPATTGTPSTTDPPATTGSPSNTDPPATTGTPTTTDPPATTGTPSTTDPPATTRSPTTTDPSATTGSPTSTDPPSNTGTPSHTDLPATTKTPSITDPPATTKTPTTTDPPATTGSPTTSEPPATTRAPITSEPPATTGTRSTTDPPSTTGTPAITETTSITETALTTEFSVTTEAANTAETSLNTEPLKSTEPVSTTHSSTETPSSTSMKPTISTETLSTAEFFSSSVSTIATKISTSSTMFTPSTSEAPVFITNQCGGTVQVGSGQTIIEYLPEGGYQSYEFCIWTLVPTDAYSGLTIDFIPYGIEEFFDGVTIYNWDASGIVTSIIEPNHGNSTLELNKPYAAIAFSSDSESTGLGFQITITATEKSDGAYRYNGFLLNQTEVTFSYPEETRLMNYAPNERVAIVVQTVSAFWTKLTEVSIDYTDIGDDLLLVYELYPYYLSGTAKIIGTTNGLNPEGDPSLFSKSPYPRLLLFHSNNNSNTGKGFSISLKPLRS